MNQIDIHKLIDEAIEKKDRYVSLLVSKDSVHITVYPLGEDDCWEETATGRFMCSACGHRFEFPSPYCPVCGEKLKQPK